MKLPKTILTGANHLAIYMVNRHPPITLNSTYEQVLADHGQPYADIWVCWKAIMDARNKKE